MRANQLVKENVKTLLSLRHQHAKDLAQWCYRSESWISKILKEARRKFSISDLDRIADFFGIATYQLFQPGISTLTERRLQHERRTGRERRIGRSQQLMVEVAAELSRVRSPKAHEEAPLSAKNVETLVASFERQLAALLPTRTNARDETAMAGARKPSTRPRRGTPRGPNDRPPKA